MDPFEIGDPFIEWEETNSARDEGEKDMGEEFNVESLKADVVKILVTEYDFLMDTASDAVEEHFDNNEDMWNANASANDLAKFLASDGDDD